MEYVDALHFSFQVSCLVLVAPERVSVVVPADLEEASVPAVALVGSLVLVL